MRGTVTFDTVFNNENSPAKRKGRNNHLIRLRNECLIDRYYYYGAFTKKRYEIIIDHLSHEFFLATNTVPGIIETHLQQLIELKEKNRDILYLQRRWPHIKW